MSRSRGGSLVGTAMALMTSTVASAGLGFAFWVVAARFFPAAAVGTMSAGVASMTLLGGVAQLNLHSMYGRFLPRAGPHTRRLLLAGYAASAVTALGLATGFLALGMASGVLPDRTGTHLLFVTGVLATAIFLIQDGVLTALGRAKSVPLKNIIGSAAKLILLPIFAGAAGGDGLLFAWTLPIIVVMLGGNAWIMTRLVPEHAKLYASAERIQPREVFGFASAEYVNGVINNVVAFLPPLLVTNVLGGESGAYFYLPWVIGVSVTTLLWNVVSSFVVQASGGGSAPPAPRGRHHLPPVSHAHSSVQRAVTMVGAVCGGGLVTLTLGAGPLLSIFDGEYAPQGAPALRLIGLSLPFTGIFILYGAFSVMEKRMWRMVGIQIVGAAVFLAGAWLGLPRLGLEAPAWALLFSQAGTGLILLPDLISKYRAVGSRDRAPAWATPDAVVPDIAVRASNWIDTNPAPPVDTAVPQRKPGWATADPGVIWPDPAVTWAATSPTISPAAASGAAARPSGLDTNAASDRAAAWADTNRAAPIVDQPTPEDRQPVYAHGGS
jgi:O-antigen/teichoic acid export membrane protein